MEPYKNLRHLETIERLGFFTIKNIYSISQVLNDLTIKSKHNLIVRHDSDDYMYDNRLSILKKTFMSSLDPDIVGTQYTINHKASNQFDETNRRLCSASFQTVDTIDQDVDIKIKLLLCSPYCHPTIAFKKSKVKHLYDTCYKYAQDLKLFIDNLFECKFHIIQNTTLDYTMTKQHLDQNSFKRQMQLMLHDRALCKLHKNLLNHQYDVSKSIHLRLTRVTQDVGIKEGPYSNILRVKYDKNELDTYYELLVASLKKRLR